MWLIYLLLMMSSISYFPMHAAAQTGISPDPVRVKADLKKILSSSDFQISKPEENAVTRAWKWISEEWDTFWKWVKDIFRAIFSSNIFGGGSSGIQWILITLFIVLGIVIIYRLFINFRTALMERREAEPISFSISNEQSERFEDPDTLMKNAEELASQKRFREALQALYLGTLLQMNRKGLLQYQLFRTNGEYLALLNRAHLSEFLTPFAALTDLFEKNWYGLQNVNQAAFENSRLHSRTVEKLIDSTPAIPSANSGKFTQVQTRPTVVRSK